MADPFAGRSEVTADEWIAVVGGNGDAPTATQMPQDAPKEPPKAITVFDEFLERGGYGRVEREARFHPTRRWRFDWYLPDQRPPVAFEYDGLMRHGENQGHTSIGAVLRDVDKINEAQAMGIRVFRVNARTIWNGEAFDLARRVLEGTG